MLRVHAVNHVQASLEPCTRLAATRVTACLREVQRHIDTLPHQRWAEEAEEKLKLTRAMMSENGFGRYNTESFSEGYRELRNAIAEAERFRVDALADNEHGALANTAAYKQHGATLTRAKERLRELDARRLSQISAEVRARSADFVTISF